MLKVLFAASEAVPFAKTGGLADVAGSLPKELRRQGVDVRLIMPKYGSIKSKYKEQMQHLATGAIQVAWRKKFIGIDYLEH
ncbi:MAG: glycogen/starch synthase, partial [Selenomonadaceae bacterium]